MWVRGLKQYHSAECFGDSVAPYVGAWIETHCMSLRNLHHRVAPYVGAWIETPLLPDLCGA